MTRRRAYSREFMAVDVPMTPQRAALHEADTHRILVRPPLEDRQTDRRTRRQPALRSRRSHLYNVVYVFSCFLAGSVFGTVLAVASLWLGGGL